MCVTVLFENSATHGSLRIPREEEVVHLTDNCFYFHCLLRRFSPWMIVPEVAFAIERLEDVLHEFRIIRPPPSRINELQFGIGLVYCIVENKVTLDIVFVSASSRRADAFLVTNLYVSQIVGLNVLKQSKNVGRVVLNVDGEGRFRAD